MLKDHLATRAVAVLLAVCFINMMMPSITAGQTPDCSYDRNNPTLDSARINFKSLNYLCAEQEIEAFLSLDKVTLEERADAHVLLAAVYYAKLKNEGEKRNRVIEQFKQAFRSYRDWKGELDISSTEFIEMMNSAQSQVDVEMELIEQQKAAEDEDEKPAVVPVETTAAAEQSTVKAAKPWYTKWWAIGLGVGLVAGAVVLATGGSSSDGGEGTPDEPLPDFPDPPDVGK